MSITFDFKKIAFYVPRIIFGSQFLLELTSISFTENALIGPDGFDGSEPDFARPLKIKPLGPKT